MTQEQCMQEFRLFANQYEFICTANDFNNGIETNEDNLYVICVDYDEINHHNMHT